MPACPQACNQPQIQIKRILNCQFPRNPESESSAVQVGHNIEQVAGNRATYQRVHDERLRADAAMIALKHSSRARDAAKSSVSSPNGLRGHRIHGCNALYYISTMMHQERHVGQTKLLPIRVRTLVYDWPWRHLPWLRHDQRPLQLQAHRGAHQLHQHANNARPNAWCGRPNGAPESIRHTARCRAD